MIGINAFGLLVGASFMIVGAGYFMRGDTIYSKLAAALIICAGYLVVWEYLIQESYGVNY